MTGSISVDEVRATVGEKLAAHGRMRLVAQEQAQPFDADLWRELSSELGIGALLVPEHAGGLELGVEYACAAIEAAARRGSVAPIRSTLTATAALARSSDACAEHWLTRTAETAAVGAVTEVEIGCQQSSVCVVDGCEAHYLVVVRGDQLFLADHANGVISRGRLTSIDFAHDYAQVDVDLERAHVLSTTAADAAYVVDLNRLALAAEAIGVARGSLAMARDYACERTQFGQVIGEFQAVAHRLADLLVAIEGAAALHARAVADLAVDGQTPLAPLAAAQAGATAVSAARTLIQTLGGLGFTWEHDAHLWYRRAHALSVELGTPGQLETVAVQRDCLRQVAR